jgi:hypothetical protein
VKDHDSEELAHLLDEPEAGTAWVTQRDFVRYMDTSANPGQDYRVKFVVEK